MKRKQPSPISQAASLMGKKGGKRTLELHGPEHFSKASKARKHFRGGWPKGRPRKPKGKVDRSKGKQVPKSAPGRKRND